MTVSAADQTEIFSVFFPYAYRRHNEIKRTNGRFVHYTSAEAAFSMIRNKEVWMRKSTCMTDFMEVEHGLNCLANAYNKSEFGARFKTALDNLYSGASQKLQDLFNAYQDHFRYDTYLTCLSEHDDSEDFLGRLSMWRAYGRNTGIAIVLNNAPFFGDSDALKVYSSPVAYLNDEEFAAEFAKVVENIEKQGDLFKRLGEDMTIGTAFTAFRAAALCTKHPGFKEEREWRLFHTPALDSPNRLVKEIQIVDRVPQPVYKIQLKDIPDEVTGVEIPTLVNRVIIGPTRHPMALREAIVDLLREAGMQDADERVFYSAIPLRT